LGNNAKEGRKMNEEARTKYVLSKVGKVVPLRLLPGTDVMNGIKQVCEENGIRGGAVLMGIGSVRKLTIQILKPNEKAKIGSAYGAPEVTPGPIEILGIQGIIYEVAETGELALHLHGNFCDKDGKTFGGHLVPGENPILATLDTIIVEFANVNIKRRYDEETDLNMFSPELP
jgi:predicted DNA-binding protein with PD1-like motif